MKSFFYESMSHESRYKSVSGFSPKVRIRFRVRVGVGFSVRVRIRVRVTGVFFFLRLNILTHDSLKLQSHKNITNSFKFSNELINKRTRPCYTPFVSRGLIVLFK